MGQVCVETNTPDSYINLKLQLKHNSVGLSDVFVYFQSVSPLQPNIAYYLCCDLVQETPLQVDQEDIRYFPILRRLQFNNDHPSNGISVYTPVKLFQTFPQLHKIPARHVDVEGFRLYLIDSAGNVPSLANFQLKCTLVYQQNYHNF